MDLKRYCKSKYLIFDFDGTIVDSERFYYNSWREAALEYGYKLSDEELLSFRSADASLTYPFFGSMEKYSLVRNLRKQKMESLLKTQRYPLKSGIYEAIKGLNEKGYEMVIATSGDPKIVNMHLEYYDLKKYFKAVFSARNIKRGKPYPDIYLALGASYNLNLQEVIAIEDSPNGIKSAYNAGCNVIMIPDLSPISPDLAKLVIAVLPNAKDLLDLL